MNKEDETEIPTPKEFEEEIQRITERWAANGSVQFSQVFSAIERLLYSLGYGKGISYATAVLNKK